MGSLSIVPQAISVCLFKGFSSGRVAGLSPPHPTLLFKGFSWVHATLPQTSLFSFQRLQLQETAAAEAAVGSLEL